MNFINSLIPALRRNLAVSHGRCDQALGETIEPHYEVKETDDAFGVTVTLPGIAKDGLEITADDKTLRIVGRHAWKRPNDWTSLYRETSNAPYLLEFEHENSIDANKVEAELRDGILQVRLRKTEAVKPRKIAVG
jgi:HSP20 family protein